MTIFYCRLNPAPTDVQRALYRRHRAAGTSPGNPKWYNRIAAKLPAPFTFVPGRKPVYPRLPTGADWNAKHNPNSATERRPVVTKYKSEGTT